MPTRKAKLTDKEERFVREYMVDCNATQAVIRSGFAVKASRQKATQLLSKVHIQDAIAEAMLDLCTRLEVKVEDWLREVWILSTSDPNNYYFGTDDHGRPRIMVRDDVWLPNGIEREWLTRAIKAVDYEKRKIMLWDKPKSLHMIGLNLGLLLNEAPPMQKKPGEKHTATLSDDTDEGSPLDDE